MLIADGMSRVFDEVAARERDLMRSYTPGAIPEMNDVAADRRTIETLDPLSATAPENTYFVTSDDRGRALFGRDGSFQLRDGSLVDTQGRPVLGFAGAGSPLRALRADPVDAALGFTNAAAVEADGSVWYERRTVDPRTRAPEMIRVCIGRVALARFAAGTKLQGVGPQHFSSPSGVSPHIGMPADGNFAELQCSSKEGSGIDIDRGLDRLREAYLALDALRAASVAQLGVSKTAMDLLK